MAVKLRLKRLGRKHRSFFRLAATEARNPRDGRVLEELGFYDPQNKVEAQQVRLNAERIKYWLGVGAVPSDTVRDLLKKNGIATK
jgi:small subunit ribosomal protein S16